MDTSLIDCDVQTNYVRVTLKGKVCLFSMKSSSAHAGLVKFIILS